MRMVFAAGAILGAISFANQAIVSARAAAVFGFFWNYFDAVGGYIAAYDQYCSAREATRHKAEKYAISAVNFFGSTQLLAGTTLSLLAFKGVLIGTTAAIASPLGTVGFAVCMLISASIEAYLLVKAIRKCDMEYLLQDRLIKYQRLIKKLTL